jgi:membrane protease YdiL (CAAX protease family)
VILTVILYLGAIYTDVILEPKTRTNDEGPSSGRLKEIINIFVVRALILGPLYEEIVFRGCILAFHSLVSPADQLSKTNLIFTTPLWFGFGKPIPPTDFFCFTFTAGIKTWCDLWRDDSDVLGVIGALQPMSMVFGRLIALWAGARKP